MKKRLYTFTESLVEALKKGAHRKEVTQQEFVNRALVKELRYLGDAQIDALLDNHEANCSAHEDEKLGYGSTAHE